MGLVNLSDILKDANEKSYAVGMFDIFNCEMLKAVISASECKHSPVILAYVEVFDTICPMEAFSAMVKEVVSKASVPVCLHLDHATNRPIIERAIACGFTSVMIDASTDSLEKNIARTKEIVELCCKKNISVEAELGHVSGNGEMYDNDDTIYTDVNEAVEFVEQTKVDALAIAIGTTHGVYKKEPKLDIECCGIIKQSINNLPLVLHGASGLTENNFIDLIRSGITKINIYTDITNTAVNFIKEYNNESYFEVSCKMIERMEKEVCCKIELFGSQNRV